MYLVFRYRIGVNVNYRRRQLNKPLVVPGTQTLEVFCLLKHSLSDMSWLKKTCVADAQLLASRHVPTRVNADLIPIKLFPARGLAAVVQH